jgi:hypothetical protein
MSTRPVGVVTRGTTAQRRLRRVDRRLLVDLDAGWSAHAAPGVFGPRQRFAGAARDLRSRGWPVLDGPARWRRGEVAVSWKALDVPAR